MCIVQHCLMYILKFDNFAQDHFEMAEQCTATSIHYSLDINYMFHCTTLPTLTPNQYMVKVDRRPKMQADVFKLFCNNQNF